MIGRTVALKLIQEQKKIKKGDRKMKKVYQALIFSLLFMLSIGINAEAGYVAGENSYTDSDINGAHTVVIYRGTDSMIPENIFYANQSAGAGGFSDLKMLMKLNAPAGEYTVKMNSGISTTSKTFEISDAQAYVSGGKAVEFLDVESTGEGVYSVAFGLSPAVLFSGVSKLVMVIDNDNKAYSTDLVGEDSIINWKSGTIHLQDGYFMFAIQIDNVDAEYITNNGGTYTPKFSLFVK